MKYLITRFSALPCYLVPLRHGYHPLHPILDHPLPSITLSVVTLFQAKFNVYSLLHISQPSHVLHISTIAVFYLALPCSNSPAHSPCFVRNMIYRREKCKYALLSFKSLIDKL